MSLKKKIMELEEAKKLGKRASYYLSDCLKVD